MEFKHKYEKILTERKGEMTSIGKGAISHTGNRTQMGATADGISDESTVCQLPPV